MKKRNPKVKVDRNVDIKVERPCTKGHEVRCFYAKSDHCTCDCGGANHGK